jgi:hypothetical protein
MWDHAQIVTERIPIWSHVLLLLAILKPLFNIMTAIESYGACHYYYFLYLYKYSGSKCCSFLDTVGTGVLTHIIVSFVDIAKTVIFAGT